MSTPSKQPSLILPVIGMMLFTFLAAYMAAFLTFRQPQQQGPGSSGPYGTRTAGFGAESDTFDKFPLPEFSFTAQDGTTFTRNSMLGKVWAVDFIFTRCPGPCPIITRNFSAFQKIMPQEPEYRLLTITVDPVNDTPAVLKEFGENMGANFERWTFLTGPKDPLYAFIWNGFKVVAEDNSSEANLPMEEKFLHSVKVALVDKQGNIRGYYDGTTMDAAAWTKLRNDMLRLGAE